MSHLRSRLEGGLLVGMNSLQGNCRMSEVEPKMRGPLNPFFVCVILSCTEQVMWVGQHQWRGKHTTLPLCC